MANQANPSAADRCHELVCVLLIECESLVQNLIAPAEHRCDVVWVVLIDPGAKRAISLGDTALVALGNDYGLDLPVGYQELRISRPWLEAEGSHPVVLLEKWAIDQGSVGATGSHLAPLVEIV